MPGIGNRLQTSLLPNFAPRRGLDSCSYTRMVLPRLSRNGPRLPGRTLRQLPEKRRTPASSPRARGPTVIPVKPLPSKWNSELNLPKPLNAEGQTQVQSRHARNEYPRMEAARARGRIGRRPPSDSHPESAGPAVNTARHHPSMGVRFWTRGPGGGHPLAAQSRLFH